MKSVRLFAIPLAFLFAACGSDQSEQAGADAADNGYAAKTTAAVKTAEISVPTIQCSGCADTIKEALVEVEGVSEAKVDLDSKMAMVSYDGGKTDLKSLELAIAGYGYHANETKRDPDAYLDLDSCCQEPKDGGGHEH